MFHSVKARLSLITAIVVFCFILICGIVVLHLVPLVNTSFKIYLVITGIALAAAVIISLFSNLITGAVIKPVKTLIDATRRLSTGDFKLILPGEGRDEISELTRAFARMANQIDARISSLQSSRDDLSAIISGISDGILVVNRDKKITMVNDAAARILDIDARNAIGYTFIEKVFDYEINNMVQLCMDNRQKQSGLVVTGQNKLALGVIANPMPSDEGCLVLLQDLTEIRRFEKERHDFISNVSHELRTPIASIKAIAETLKDGAIDNRPIAMDFLEKIDNEIDRLSQMVAELSELSRIESGEGALNKKPFDFGEMLNSLKDRFQNQISRAGLNITILENTGTTILVADREKIEQVLANLVNNAIKFTPAGGKITLSAINEGNSILFTVADTGAGISSEDLPRIFERFYKVDKSRSTGGTGLGLSIAKKIVDSHGGRIWAESAEGKGASFYFNIPLYSH